MKRGEMIKDYNANTTNGADSEDEEDSARLMLFRQEGMLDVARDGNCFFICISKFIFPH